METKSGTAFKIVLFLIYAILFSWIGHTLYYQIFK